MTNLPIVLNPGTQAFYTIVFTFGVFSTVENIQNGVRRMSLYVILNDLRANVPLEPIEKFALLAIIIKTEPDSDFRANRTSSFGGGVKFGAGITKGISANWKPPS